MIITSQNINLQQKFEVFTAEKWLLTFYYSINKLIDAREERGHVEV